MAAKSLSLYCDTIDILLNMMRNKFSLKNIIHNNLKSCYECLHLLVILLKSTAKWAGRRKLNCLVCVLSRFSCIQVFATLQTVARQAPLSTGFPRQENWSGLPRPPPEDLPDPGINPHLSGLLPWQAGSLLVPLGSPKFSLGVI